MENAERSARTVVGSKGIDSPPPLKKETEITTEQANAVRRLVAALARDDADREQLLDALGLTEVPA